MSGEFHVSLPAKLSAVRGLAEMVEEFGDANRLSPSKVYMINLALEELITNTVSYGLEGVVDPEIGIGMRVRDGVLAVTVVDNGHPFDPTQDTNPDLSSPIEERPIGGLGLHLVKVFADRIVYEYAEGRNCLTLEHDLASGDA